MLALSVAGPHRRRLHAVRWLGAWSPLEARSLEGRDVCERRPDSRTAVRHNNPIGDLPHRRRCLLRRDFTYARPEILSSRGRHVCSSSAFSAGECREHGSASSDGHRVGSGCVDAFASDSVERSQPVGRTLAAASVLVRSRGRDAGTVVSPLSRSRDRLAHHAVAVRACGNVAPRRDGQRTTGRIVRDHPSSLLRVGGHPQLELVRFRASGRSIQTARPFDGSDHRVPVCHRMGHRRVCRLVSD